MNSDLYQVLFRGETDGMRPVGEVKKNLAALFKAPPEKIERLFSGSAVAIRKNIDHATALKYQATMKRAGALSEVLPMNATVKPATVVADTAEAGMPKVIAPRHVRGSLAYSPILCSTLSGNSATFDLNRADMRDMPIASIRLVSIFREQPDPDSLAVDSMALYIDGLKRPLLVELDHIRFGAFPNVAGANLLRSVQNFIRFLIRTNGNMAIDTGTQRFLADGQYTEINNQLDYLTALGEALD